VLAGAAAMAAIVLMLNYLAATRLHLRHDLLAAGRPALSPLTLATLASLTNDVRAVVLFDAGSDLFRHVNGLLREYALRSPRLKLEVVDSVRDPALASAIKSRYALGQNTGDIVVFDAGEGRHRTVDDSEMSAYDMDVRARLEGATNEIRRIGFHGEALFTAALAGLAENATARAYFLAGHGECDPASDDDTRGYSRFVRLLEEKNIAQARLTNMTPAIPDDCALLVIAGATQPLLSSEVGAVARYMERGGRLLVLLAMETVNRPGALEALLEEWGVGTPAQFASDERFSARGFDVIVSAYGSHPVTTPLTRAGSRLHFQIPRVVAPIPEDRLPADAPKPRALATTSPGGRTMSQFDGRQLSFVEGRDREGEIPLAVASEKGGVSGLSAGKATARLVVVGDATLFANGPINSLANRDFASLSVGWLLDRRQALAIGPRAISEYRLNLPAGQLRVLRVVLLGALPGSILALGMLVWMRRRA
jgi:hypothetical protein